MSVTPLPASEEGLRIETVRGPISPEELGVTMAHDHVLIDTWRMTEEFDDYSTILDDEELAVDELERLRSAGGRAICDPTNVGIGRNPEALRRVSEAAGVHVLMGSGWYRERVYPPYVSEESPDRLADRLVNELTSGVADSGIRPGFIGEIGTGRYHISPAEERVFRAAARAQLRTGCAIMTHTTHWGELALQQLDLLQEEGVSPNRVILSHLGDRPGVRWLLPIAERGAYISVDNLAFSEYGSLEVRAANVVALWRAGHGAQIVLSNDICKYSQLNFYGGCGYANLIVNFLPILRTYGLTEQQIDMMLVTNPMNAFSYATRS